MKNHFRLKMVTRMYCDFSDDVLQKVFNEIFVDYLPFLIMF